MYEVLLDVDKSVEYTYIFNILSQFYIQARGNLSINKMGLRDRGGIGRGGGEPSCQDEGGIRGVEAKKSQGGRRKKKQVLKKMANQR